VNYAKEELKPYEDLCEAVASGATPDYLFFYGHAPKSARLGSECLSQWFPAPFVVGATTYPTAEHYMMAAKAELFGDLETREQILAAPSPHDAKELGRLVRNFDSDVWTKHRFDIVVTSNYKKFSTHPALGEYLLSTAPRVLVEASPYDKVWGVGLAKSDVRISIPRFWEGPNLLGFALMKVRSYFPNPPQ
jgi:ribA/ribD-fused uncharacterized protein